MVQTSSYNPANQLTGAEAAKAGTTLTDFAYTVDNAGMRTAVTTPAGLESYTYDDLYRLSGVTYPDSSTQAYTYDGVGNRLTKPMGGGRHSRPRPAGRRGAAVARQGRPVALGLAHE